MYKRERLSTSNLFVRVAYLAYALRSRRKGNWLEYLSES